MQPKARKNSHRGIRRSEAPCSASNNHRVADERHSMITNNYDTNSEDFERHRFPGPQRLARSLLIGSFDLGLADPAGHLRRAREIRPIPSAAQRLNQLYRRGHGLSAQRSESLLVGEQRGL